MNKSRINPKPEYFDKYINLITEDELSDALAASSREIDTLDLALLASLDGKRYAPGKWTVKDILQHVIDTERIFCYRALRFARNDSIALPGFDENLYAENTTANSRTIDSLLDELKEVRIASITLFRNFDETMLLRVGRCWNYDVSVLAFGFLIPGHQRHHFNVIEKLYRRLAA